MESSKHALVTGATSGIGYELAKLLAKDGYNLVLVARNLHMLEETADEMAAVNESIHCHIIEANLFDSGAAQMVYNKTRELGIRIDILINNAGQGEWGLFANTDIEREIDLVQLNVVSMMTLTKLFLKDMLAFNKGRILNLASSVSRAPSPYLAVYAATKAFVLSFTEALIRETQDSEVTLTALQPGPTDTDFFYKARAENSVTYKEADLYSPEEVAEAGYKGMMAGEATVVPGFKNKTQEVLNVFLPDSSVSASMEAQLKPSKETEPTRIQHAASARERAWINRKMGTTHGDMLN